MELWHINLLEKSQVTYEAFLKYVDLVYTSFELSFVICKTWSGWVKPSLCWYNFRIIQAVNNQEK
jgi:hypothetical protein